MNNLNFIKQFSIIPNNYIILYNDSESYNEEKYIKLINEIKNINNNLNIIRFLLKDESKEKLSLNQIYPDLYTEDILINHCLCIIYLSKIKRSEILLNRLNLYNKIIIYEEDNIIINIYDIFNNNIDKILLLKNNLNNFIQKYSIMTFNKDISIEKNININYNKIIKEYPINNKINILTYYKKFDIKILNIIQQKSIVENLKNKNILKVIVLGKDIESEFIEINNTSKLEFIEIENEVTFKNLIKVSNSLPINSIICILRSDIILPNQNDLDDLNFDLSSNNEIYVISRIERLLNGNLVKSDKLSKSLFSTEQDGWIFKSPLNININLLDNILFYDKYSELLFNKILYDNKYKIINNTSKFKIIRLIYENNINSRTLLNNMNKIKDIDDIYLVPDNNLLYNISIDNLLQYFKINNNDIYEIKCDIFNKYLKNKISNEFIT